MGREASIGRALGFLQGVTAYLQITVGPRDAYGHVQRQADSLAEQIILPGEERSGD